MTVTDEYGYNVVFERQPNGGHCATVPTSGYLTTEGDALEEAREMVKDMIALYLESLCEDGLELPEPDIHTEVLTERISVPSSAECHAARRDGERAPACPRACRFFRPPLLGFAPRS